LSKAFNTCISSLKPRDEGIVMRLSAEVLQANLEVDLYSAGWENSDIYPGISQDQVAMSSLRRSIIKKFHNEVTDKKRDDAALQLFLSCNDKCKNFTTIAPAKLDEEYILGEMKNLVWDFFNPRCNKTEVGDTPYREPLLLNRTAIASNFGWGGGSNIGSKSTDFYSKSSTSTMASTNDTLVSLFRQDISSTSRLWGDVEAYRSKVRGYEIAQGSRLSFVPKTSEISRTICTEPLLNMLYQQGIGRVLESRLREVFNIDLSLQPSRNARLARIGSVDGRFGTIDLSSASDTISLRLCEQLIPREAMSWLRLCRSPHAILPDGSLLELHMISSMGNAFTFPLQTMIFACLVAAAYRVYDIKLHRPDSATDGNFAVFGDDIIVDRRVYDAVVRCLEILGFTVNRNKSFNEGLFRESCGSDWFSGRNVRGVYISRLLSDGDVYSAINRLNRWSAFNGIPLINAVSYLRRGCRFLGVPYDEADDAGIKVPLALARHARGDLHGTYTYLALCNLPLHASIPALGCDEDLSVRDVDLIREKLPDFFYNQDGLLLAAITGHLRNGRLGLRLNRRRSTLRRRRCPGWDRYPSGNPELDSFGDRWKAFTAMNLSS
jgi:hypothetical protein